MNDRTLFDVDRTTTAFCPVCHAARLAGQDNAPKCLVDIDRSMGNNRPRPKGCLNAHDPAHAPFPEGF